MSERMTERSKCDIVFGKELSEGIYFGKDHQGNSVVIKKIIPDNPDYIDVHCRFRHPNLLQGDILVPGICKIDHVILLLEPAIYSLKDFIDLESKNESYFRRAEFFADDLIRGLSFLHKNFLCHNMIHERHCLIMASDTAVLTDFKYVTSSSPNLEIIDNKNLGLVFLKMFTLSESESNLTKYMSVFGKKMPYQNLLYGKNYYIQDDIYEKDLPLVSLDSRFKYVFTEIVKYFDFDDSLDFVFSCLHNLHRHCRCANSLLPDLTAENIIKFTEYAVYHSIQADEENGDGNVDNGGNDKENLPPQHIDQDILKYIFCFSGILKPNTIFDTCLSLEDLPSCKIIFDHDYLKVFEKKGNINLKYKNLKGTSLQKMFSDPGSFLI